MGRPSGRRHQITIGGGAVDGDVGVGAAGETDLRRAGRIGRDGAAADDVGGGEDLGAVADRGDRLGGRGELLDQGDDAGVEAQIFGRATAGDDEGVVAGGGGREGGVDREVVAALLRIGLLALEVVDRGGDAVARVLAGADGVDAVADGAEDLERHHRLVVFDEVADQHQDLLGHVVSSQERPHRSQAARDRVSPRGMRRGSDETTTAR